MQITTLGTSHGAPTHSRYQTSTLLELDGPAYIIDAGEPAAATLWRLEKDLTLLRAAFITHMHGDHVGGLPQLVKIIYQRFADPDRTFTCFMPPEGKYPFLSWLAAMHIPPEAVGFDLQVKGIAQPGLIYEDEYTTVTAVNSGHMDPQRGSGFSFIFDIAGQPAPGDRRRIAFSGDQPSDFHNLGDILTEHVDVLVMEMTHIRPERVLPFIGERDIGRLILNHIHDPWHDEGEAVLRGICEQHLSFPSDIAHDYDVFPIA